MPDWRQVVVYVELVDNEIDMGCCAFGVLVYVMFSCVIGIKLMCMKNRLISL